MGNLRSRLRWWSYDHPYLSWFGSIVGMLILLFAITYPFQHAVEQSRQDRCVAVHGHFYNAGRDTLCLTSDNRVITNW